MYQIKSRINSWMKYLTEQMKSPGKYYYVCGSNSFVNNTKSMLNKLGILPSYIEPYN